jgi:hypothetical protein
VLADGSISFMMTHLTKITANSVAVKGLVSELSFLADEQSLRSF